MARTNPVRPNLRYRHVLRQNVGSHSLCRFCGADVALNVKGLCNGCESLAENGSHLTMADSLTKGTQPCDHQLVTLQLS